MIAYSLRRYCSQGPRKFVKELTVVRCLTQSDLDAFSQITGDFNPVHSSAMPIEDRRVQGALLNSLVAGILGTQLPGPGTIVLEQQYKFPNPCRIEKEIVIKVGLSQKRKISIVCYEVRQGEAIVFEGTAKLLTKFK